MKNFIDILGKFIEQTKTFFHIVDMMYFYFKHPKNLCIVIWDKIVCYSFWLCLFITLFGLITYLLGIAKGKQWAKGSLMVYITIQLFNSCLK